MYEQKYLKYKLKYLKLKNQIGGLLKINDWVCINGEIQLKNEKDKSITKNIIVKNFLAKIIDNPKANIYDVYIPEPFFEEEINNGFRSQAFNISSNQLKLLEKFNLNDNIKNLDNDKIGKIISIIPPPHGDIVETYKLEYTDKSIEILTSCKLQKYMPKLFNEGDKFKLINQGLSKNGTVRYLRNDTYEQNKNPRTFNYHVDFDDGTFDTYLSEKDMELLPNGSNPDIVLAKLKIGKYNVRKKDHADSPDIEVFFSEEQEVRIISKWISPEGKNMYNVQLIDGNYKSYYIYHFDTIEDQLRINDEDKSKTMTKYKIGQRLILEEVDTVEIKSFHCVEITNIINNHYTVKSIKNPANTYEVYDWQLYELFVNDVVYVSGIINMNNECKITYSTTKNIYDKIGKIISIQNNKYCVHFIDQTDGKVGVDIDLCQIRIGTEKEYVDEIKHIIKNINDLIQLLIGEKLTIPDIIGLFDHLKPNIDDLIKQLAGISHKINENYSNNYVIFKDIHDALIESIKIMLYLKYS